MKEHTFHIADGNITDPRCATISVEGDYLDAVKRVEMYSAGSSSKPTVLEIGFEGDEDDWLFSKPQSIDKSTKYYQTIFQVYKRLFETSNLINNATAHLYPAVMTRRLPMYGSGNVEKMKHWAEYGLKPLHIPSVLYASKMIPWQMKENSQLQGFLNQVGEDILNLENDWNGEGALAISKEIVNEVKDFLIQYYSFLDSTAGISIKLPEINPCPNGSIDLEWQTASARLLINVRKRENEYFGFYYGDKYDDKMQLKGSFPVNEFSESLAVWMKYLV